MAVRIEPWGATDITLLKLCLEDPAMTVHLGGPESAAKIAERQARYEQPGSGQYRVVDLDLDPSGPAAVGWVGYWPREWRGEPVYETGWAVIPAAQGRGVASAALAQLCAEVRARGERSAMHAFPSVANEPSNRVCAKGGFTLMRTCEFEYPKGHPIVCHDWRLELEVGI